MVQMTVRQRLTFLTISMVFALVVLMGVGIYALSRTINAGHNLELMSTAQINHMTGDEQISNAVRDIADATRQAGHDADSVVSAAANITGQVGSLQQSVKEFVTAAKDRV